MFKRIDHVGMLVENLADAKAFLAGLGFTLVKESDAPVWNRVFAYFQCGDTYIELVQDLDDAERATRLQGKTARVEHVAFEVDDIYETIEELDRKGMKLDELPPDHAGANPGAVPGVLIGDFRGRRRSAAWTKPSEMSDLTMQLVSYEDTDSPSSAAN
jgi:methylmalonyl-CoA/ethylmalonyl-CoA epimerase